MSTKVQVKHTDSIGTKYTDNFYIDKTISELENDTDTALVIADAIRQIFTVSTNTYQDSNLVMERSLEEIVTDGGN